MDSLHVPELERVIKLKISKGKAYSTLRNSKESAEVYQRSLDVSIMQYDLLYNFFLPSSYSWFCIMLLCRFFKTVPAHHLMTLTGVSHSQSSADYFWFLKWVALNRMTSVPMRRI